MYLKIMKIHTMYSLLHPTANASAGLSAKKRRGRRGLVSV